jgi:phosphate starvation-inducible PhoH-like protein
VTVGTGRVRRTLVVDDVPMLAVLGPRDEHLRTLERGLPRLDVHVRGNEMTFEGPERDVRLAERLLDEMTAVLTAGQPLTADAVERALGMLRASDAGAAAERPAAVLTANILSTRGRTIRPKTLGQKQYVDAIDAHTVVFGIGPAGTGKTYLAMAKAVQALQAKRVNRIVLTRPAVEAGERLGFLPGTLTDKIDPYLRPLYDALHDMIDPESIPRLMTAGTIEVAPLAYMRGRAQPYGARVMTPDGWVAIGSLRVGDLVTGSDGRPTPVLGVYPQGRRTVYRVTAQDGAATLACGEHLWQVRTAADRRRGRHRVLETREMIGRLRAAHAHRYELPVAGPVHMPERSVPMDPYALGLLLGDGCLTTSTTPAFATADRKGARDRVATTGSATATVGDLDLLDVASGAMSVPEPYRLNSPRVRLAVLQGLLDAAAEPVRRARSCRVEYPTTSDRLRDDVVFLVRSLGGVAHVGTRHDAHVLDIRLPADVAPFRLERKRAVYEQGPPGRPMRFVHSIEPVGEQDTLCIQVGAPDSLYVTDDFLVTHNTLNDAFIILDEAQNTSPEQMKMFLTRLGFGSKMVVTGDVTQVDLPSGTPSGLRVVSEILDGVEDLAFRHLGAEDVVRHRLVSDIVAAYGRWDARDGQSPGRRSRERP